MDDLTSVQKALLGLNLGLHAYDWNETRANVGSGGHEVNPYVGKKPGPDQINERVAATGAVGLGALALMPKEWRTAALATGALAKIALLNGNVLGNEPMWKAKDKNSYPLAIAAGTLGALGSGAFGKNWSVALSGTPKQPEIKLAFKKDF